jgi:hypothetical protein
MPSNEGSARPLQSRDEPTASATEANSANPPRRRNTVNHFAAWAARLVAGVVLVVSVIAVAFFAGFFTERDYGDIFGAVADSPLSRAGRRHLHSAVLFTCGQVRAALPSVPSAMLNWATSTPGLV